ncbi:MAG: M3 family oligoendopeptidase [Deltaproteobacteria bacterium]|nr:M3 family oligoendopeptidase [Deltaproteobacteria bacterium]
MTDKSENIRWNLTRLYASPTDPAIDRDMEEAKKGVRSFRESYHGKIAAEGFTSQELLDSVQQIEAIQEQALKPYGYAQLLFAADTETAVHKELVQKCREFFAALRNEILFFELEIIAIPNDRFEKLVGGDLLSEYRHYLRHLRIFKPYTLSEKEEQVINLKDVTGKEAFSQLFEELTASFRYRLNLEGEEREYTGEELLSMLHRPEAELREQAFTAFLERHGENSLVLSSVFNNIFLDHGGECNLRGYDSPITATHLTNELSDETIESMMSVTEENYPLAREYFRLKAELLGIKKLKNCDVYAPVAEVNRNYTFPEAREMVLAAFETFDPQMKRIAKGFFDEARIDSAIRPGKTGGAFCAGLTPTLPPYVLLNFTGNLRDVATLAHELGHGIHFTLAGRQRLMNYDAVLPMAETASVFGEMLLTKRLLSQEKDPAVRTAILCARIEDIIATTFRQNVLTRFEQKTHDKRSEKLLSPEEFCDFWWEENGRLFGDTVEMIPAYRWGWSYISHFIHARFYCYSYVFGELLVLSLYRKYQEEGTAFVPRYLDLLASGGSDSPPNLLAKIGIDVNDRAFWKMGYDLVRDLLEELKTTLRDR